jgi:hypothetical protein
VDELGIERVFIPRGGTGTYQPLDRRVVGALKSKGRAKWMAHAFQNPAVECTRPEAAELLLESWEELPEACIQSGWDLDQDPQDDDSSDDGEDEEWRIEIDERPLSDETSSDSDLIEDVVQRYGASVSYSNIQVDKCGSGPQIWEANRAMECAKQMFDVDSRPSPITDETDSSSRSLLRRRISFIRDRRQSRVRKQKLRSGTQRWDANRRN